MKRVSPLLLSLRAAEQQDVPARKAVTRCLELVARGPQPMTLPDPITRRDWTGKEIKR